MATFFNDVFVVLGIAFRAAVLPYKTEQIIQDQDVHCRPSPSQPCTLSNIARTLSMRSPTAWFALVFSGI